MKISMMTTDQAADTLVKIVEPVSRIMDDDKVAELLKGFSESKNVPYIKLFAKMLPKIVSIALDSHRDDLYLIVGALDGTSYSEVKEQNILKTMSVIKESFDKELLDFFGSIGSQEEIAKQE